MRKQKSRTMMRKQKSRGATKTSSRVAAFVAFVAAAVLLEGRGAHAASSGICKTLTNFKPDVSFEAPGFGTQTCQTTGIGRHSMVKSSMPRGPARGSPLTFK